MREVTQKKQQYTSQVHIRARPRRSKETDEKRSSNGKKNIYYALNYLVKQQDHSIHVIWFVFCYSD